MLICLNSLGYKPAKLASVGLKMARLTNNDYYVCITCLAFFALYLYTMRPKICSESCSGEDLGSQHSSENREGQHLPSLTQDEFAGPIRIALVACTKAGEAGGVKEEASVLLKSVVISTILYNTSRDIEFHLLVTNKEDEDYFSSKLQEFSNPFSQARISLQFHSAMDVVSKYYPAEMKGEERLPCLYLRIFLPNYLEDVGAILYLDTDTLITGNLEDLWSYFYKMDGGKLVAMAPDFAANNPLKPDFFKGLPFVPPKGLNSGVQLMNLAKMREYKWQEKLLRLYHDYKVKQNVSLRSDQKLTNILLFYDSGLYLQLPCHFNFWWAHCSSGFYCDDVTKDPSGIQVVHGAGNGFNKGRQLYEIYAIYRDFRLGQDTTKQKIISDLLHSIRNEYALPGKGKKLDKANAAHKSCNGVIDKYLFKSFFP